MNPKLVLKRCFVAFALCFTTTSPAQTPAPAYEPQVGQHGKDVIWVPTPQALVDRMLNLGKVTAQDNLVDLGSGDGRTVITAAMKGATALGIEYNPDMVELSKRNAEKAGVAAKAQFKKADLFETDFSHATVVTMFLLPDINLRLRPKILDMKPGTRIVSNSFTMGEWKWDESVNATSEEGCTSYCTAYLWIVPAKVAGTWKTPQGTLHLTQEFQNFSGTLTANGSAVKITNAKLNGAQISFTAGRATYSGQVNGEQIKGTMKSGANSSAWSATRETKS
ncbi:MAG: class I SAM-dependent methyltransferase [Burkholderiales bacterium]|nr:class I SAM-dependent methyltransferase [Burkholderiales bacterium]